MDVGGGMRASQIWKHRHSTEFVIGCCGDCITLTRGLLVGNAKPVTTGSDRVLVHPSQAKKVHFNKRSYLMTMTMNLCTKPLMKHVLRHLHNYQPMNIDEWVYLLQCVPDPVSYEFNPDIVELLLCLVHAMSRTYSIRILSLRDSVPIAKRND